MLKIIIPERELYDESAEEFIKTKPCQLQLCHSLVSISKWESYWNKPFLSKEPKSTEETMHYIECMTITQNIPYIFYSYLTEYNMKQINEYVESPMTATIINETKKKNGSREIITSEIIYYWMISLSIPLECQKWHLNRLLTLINVCNIKNQPPEKMGRKELNNRNRDLNAARRNALNTKG